MLTWLMTHKWVVAFLVFMALGTTIAVQQAGLTASSARIEAAGKVNVALTHLFTAADERARANAEAVTILQGIIADNAKANATAAAVRRELTALRNDITRRIEDAPPTDDAPIAPVLGLALDELRDLHPSEAAGGNDPRGADTDTGKPDRLRGGPDAAPGVERQPESDVPLAGSQLPVAGRMREGRVSPSQATGVVASLPGAPAPYRNADRLAAA